MTTRFLITAGPTREFLDPVRYLSNRSSGKMGYALATAAVRAGGAVTLVTGPVSLAVPDGITACPVTSAAEMAAAVTARFEEADVIIMAAAVCDFRPCQPSTEKIKKAKFAGPLELVPTVDILAEAGNQKRPDQVLVGFALETTDLVGNARAKLVAKQADLVVANGVEAMDADRNRVTILDRAGVVEEWPELAKTEIAERLIARIQQLVG